MRAIREPLVHFVILGAVIFAAHGYLARNETNRPGEIVVTPEAIDDLVAGFSRTWQRSPREDEVRGLIRDRVREEAAYREALALGLDRDDVIVRRRLRQKLEFVSEGLAARVEPSESELQEFLQAHRETFEVQPLFSFRHVYFNPALHGENLQRDVGRVLADLKRSSTQLRPGDLGDPFLLAQSFEKASLADLRGSFGEQFASTVVGLPVDSWQGPVASGYGVHLVYLAERTDRHLPPLAEVRDQVRRDYLDAKRREATDKFYDALLSRYSVKIASPRDKALAQAN